MPVNPIKYKVSKPARQSFLSYIFIHPVTQTGNWHYITDETKRTPGEEQHTNSSFISWQKSRSKLVLRIQHQ
jgi:hypothetical protein